MKMHKYFQLSLLVLILQLAAVMVIGYMLPADAKLPVHWNIRNEIDGWASKNTAMIPFWLFNVALYLLLMYSGKISPVFRQNRERYEAVIPLLTLVLVLFFALFHVYIMLLGLNPVWQQYVQFIFILMGLLFIFLGNILPKIPRNYLAGIKTPWTIYSDEIWRRTSRLGGYCFVIMGVGMLIKGVFNLTANWANITLLVMLVGLVFVPVLFSFWLYRFGGINEE